MNESTRALISRKDGNSACEIRLNELYNLPADPIEANNRYYQRDYRAIVEHVTRDILSWQQDDLAIP
jgi:hypothetical protein